MQKEMVKSETYFEKGNLSGSVYINDSDHWNFVSDIMRLTIVTNPLHIDEFAYTGQIEAEIVRMTIELYNGDRDCCGATTNGGTESIITAMLSYRERAKQEKGITKPNIVCSFSVHFSIDKAGHY